MFTPAVKDTAHQFIRAFPVVVTSQITLFIARPLTEIVFKAVGVSSEPYRQSLRRIFKHLTLFTIIACFFKSKRQAPLDLIQKHPWWVVIKIALILNEIPPISSIGRAIGGVLIRPWHNEDSPLVDIYKKMQINAGGEYLLKVYNRTFIASLLNELCFRAVLQEGCLRQLPRFIIQLTSQGNKIDVDSPILKALRISMSILAYASYGLKAPKNFIDESELFYRILSGSESAYLQENIGFESALLAHFGDTLYYALSTSNR